MEFVVGIVTILGLPIAWLSYRASKAAMNRTADARLWKEIEPDILQAYVTLHNKGQTEAVVDKIQVTSPKGAKVAWHKTTEASSGAGSLADPTATDTHDTLIIAKPGESVGCGMMIRLPRPYAEVPEIRFRCRLAASDQWRKYRWLEGRAMTSSAILSMDLIRARSQG